MLIVQDEIRRRQIIASPSHAKMKNSTCDLTVGEIFPLGDDISRGDHPISEFWLQPSHMVAVLTEQRIRMPKDVTGIATLVTSLTKEGILCLNAGVIDPGYSGHLSATLVNFSKQPYKVHINQRLFRVVLFQHSPIADHQFEPFFQDAESYRRDLVSKAHGQFSESFLDVKGILSSARRNAWRVVADQIGANWLAVILSAVAIIISVFLR